MNPRASRKELAGTLLPGDAPKAGVAAELAEPPKPKPGPEEVLAPKLNPVLCSRQRNFQLCRRNVTSAGGMAY